MRRSDDTRPRAALSLILWAGVGASVAVATLAVLAATGRVELHRRDVIAIASAPAPASASALCPVKTNSPMCDACMRERCNDACVSCAEEPACLRLLVCLLDCREPSCSRECERQHSGVTALLESFAGESGCMRKCRDACR